MSAFLAVVGGVLFALHHLGFYLDGSVRGLALIGGWFLLLAGVPGLIYAPVSLTRRLRADLPPVDNAGRGVIWAVELGVAAVAVGLAEVTTRFAYGHSMVGN